MNWSTFFLLTFGQWHTTRMMRIYQYASTMCATINEIYPNIYQLRQLTLEFWNFQLFFLNQSIEIGLQWNWMMNLVFETFFLFISNVSENNRVICCWNFFLIIRNWWVLHSNESGLLFLFFSPYFCHNFRISRFKFIFAQWYFHSHRLLAIHCWRAMPDRQWLWIMNMMRIKFYVSK